MAELTPDEYPRIEVVQKGAVGPEDSTERVDGEVQVVEPAEPEATTETRSRVEAALWPKVNGKRLWPSDEGFDYRHCADDPFHYWNK